MTASPVSPRPRQLPPRRLLAAAAAFALFGGQAYADPAQKQQAAGPDSTPGRPVGVEASCPLGSFRCAPRPVSYAMCRPNALLEFYDPALTRDSTLRETSNTNVQAQHVDSSDQTVYKLTGQVRIERADQLLHADVAHYNDDTTDYDAQGSVRYQDSGQLMAADHVRGNNEQNRGIADNVSYQLLQSRGNGTATRANMLDAQRTDYTQATFSTCDIGHHLWEIRGKSIKTDKNTGVGVARSATMRFAHVPILYLPYFTFPIDDRRKSGFLTPMIGNTSRAGFMVSTPYYLNLAPNYDATLDPRLYTQRGPMLGGEFRYLLPTSNGILNFEYLPNDRGTYDANDPTAQNTQGDKRWMLHILDSTHLVGPWSLSANINRVSDRNYLRDFGNDMFYNGQVAMLTSSTYINGGGNWWNASFGVDSYQNADPYLPDSIVQYKRWPRATLGLDLPITRWLEFGMDDEAVAFKKDNVVEGKRLDLEPYLAADFRGASWFVRPKLAYRYTAYQLDGGYDQYGYYGRLGGSDTTPFNSRTPSRSLPIASLDSGLVFDRSTSLFGKSYTQTLEPRLYYLYVPYRNQSNLPLFDTNLMSFDYWQLFSPNRYSGADRQMDANNLTAALTTRLLDDNGVERLAASIGQIHYFSTQKVQLPNSNTTVTPPVNWTKSDYVVQLNMQLSDQWRLNTSYQWNPETRLTDLGVLELQRRLGGDGIINFSYRYRRTPGTRQSLLEQYDASAVYPISDRWRALARWTYSVKQRRTVEAMAGFEYDSCCVAFRVLERHYVNGYNYATTDTHTNNAIMFELEFKGLGAFNSQTEDFLHRAILGYQ
ncbi:LPS-assembly protein LptD [Frateuria defendens]|uniref:LPS-assembly protein LptD n=1 Tax=Frateuria defendens TaxID=2219559 RepID=UPI00066FC5A3|nr:LPS assembly protein LptD [Frateuria defendens]